MDIKSEITKILHTAGVTGEVELTTPPKPEMGDFAFACFNLAKEWKMNPAEAAAKLSEDLRFKIKDCCESVQAFGPYVNFFLNTGVLAEGLIPVAMKKGYGQGGVGKDKEILIEYPSNNTHKELHVGHLRNICLGNSLVNIFKACGYKVTPINYLNDFGSHISKCLWYLLKFHKNDTPSKDKQRWLGELYVKANSYLADHPEVKIEMEELQRKIENHDKSIWPLFEKTRQWSIDGFNVFFKELGLIHKKVFYEQDVKDVGQKLVDTLLRKKIAQIGEGGAVIVDLNKFNLDIGLLRKSNGLGLYLTSDLGLAQLKHKKYPKIFESVHLTGTEQNFYFKQLFKILELAGFDYKMKHIGYGLVSLSTGKMSSRAGNVLLYEDLRDEVYKKLLSETGERHPQWSKNKVAKTAFAIAMAAIKFEFLKHEAEKVVVFDPAAAVSFDGFTGPYVLYTVARINSIIKKSSSLSLRSTHHSERRSNLSALATPEEKRLLLLIAQFGEVIKKALDNYNPSVIVKYSFDMAQAYNDFYAKHSVLQADNPDLIAARLKLSMAVRKVLIEALGLLSIGVVGEM